MQTIAHLIGSEQAAKRFGVNRATFNRWVAAGTIPITLELAGKTGTRLFDPEVIDRLAAEYAEKASA